MKQERPEEAVYSVVWYDVDFFTKSIVLMWFSTSFVNKKN